MLLRAWPATGTRFSPWPAQLHHQQRLRCAALPTTSQEVLTWAHTEFLELVSRTRQAARPLPLGKACLLLALEEQAMQQIDAARGETHTTCCASTWDLTRLDALAHEVAQQLEDHGTPWHPGSTPQEQGQQGQQEGQQGQEGQEEGQQGSSSLGSEEMQGEQTNTNSVSLNTNSKSDSRSGDISSSSSSMTTRHGTISSDDGLVGGRHTPLQVLLAVNGVMFERHGYQACNRWGVTGDADMAAVMEEGRGSCAALCILYWEVCRRVGLSLAAARVEGGRYCIMWPACPAAAARLVHPGDTAAGLLVLDVYGEGALLTQQEVCELFELHPEDFSRPSDACTELLAALLCELVVTHWSQAVGCSPAPAHMVPLSPATALSGRVSQLRSSSIRQAVAAAHKLVALLPGQASPLLQYAVLLFFDGRFEDAWLELGSYLEAVGAGTYSQRRQPQQEGEEQTASDSRECNSSSSSSSSSSGGAGEGGVAALPQADCVLNTPADSNSNAGYDGAASCQEEPEVAAARLLMDRLQLELLVGAVPHVAQG